MAPNPASRSHSHLLFLVLSLSLSRVGREMALFRCDLARSTPCVSSHAGCDYRITTRNELHTTDDAGTTE